jgi:hypothetical protein
MQIFKTETQRIDPRRRRVKCTKLAIEAHESSTVASPPNVEKSTNANLQSLAARIPSRPWLLLRPRVSLNRDETTLPVLDTERT